MSDQYYGNDFSDLSDGELKQLAFDMAQEMRKRGMTDESGSIYLPQPSKRSAGAVYTESQMGDTLREYADLWANGAALGELIAYIEGAAGLVGDPLRGKLGLLIASKSLDKLPLAEQERLSERANIGGELAKALHNTLAAAYKISHDLGEETKEAFYEIAIAYKNAIQAVNEGRDDGSTLMNIVNAFDPNHSGVAAITARYLLPGRKVNHVEKQDVREVVIAKVEALKVMGKTQDAAINDVITYYYNLPSTVDPKENEIKRKLEASKDPFSLISSWIGRNKKTIQLSVT
jgi:hypothetical protein